LERNSIADSWFHAAEPTTRCVEVLQQPAADLWATKRASIDFIIVVVAAAKVIVVYVIYLLVLVIFRLFVCLSVLFV